MGLFFCSYTFVNSAFWLLLSFHLTLAYFTSSKNLLCHDDERSSLLQFKESLIIDEAASDLSSAYAKVESWRDHDCCSWDGIRCNEDTGHVIKLDLTSSCLYGSINSSSSLFRLVHLEWLSLADNVFNYSKIPSTIMNLSRLTHLDLSYSAFSGQIPSEILELSKLVFLNVSRNSGNLELKSWGFRSLAEMWSKLNMLDLSWVTISSPIIHALANLSSLTYLSLEDCEMQGEFPTKFFLLPKLCFLNVAFNRELTVYLPEFEKNNPLEELRLSGTILSAGIPNSIGNLKSLSYLDIRGCRLQGRVPFSLGNLTHLSYLSLSFNEISGELPTFIGSLVSLEMLHLSSSNFFSQTFSSLSWITNLTKLTYLDISHNNFSSQNISSLSWIANLTKLTYLDLSRTNLVGDIPTWFLSLTQLTNLILFGNKLTGVMPFWLMNLNQLKELSLQRNQLSGQIPFEIGNLTQLTTLNLGINRLEGTIPSSIFELKNLEALNLYSNNLSGTLSLDMLIINLKSLEVLVLSSNDLSLLTETTVCTSFQKFFVIGLGSCNLSTFPNFLQNQQRLMSLDLSSNKLAGQIPRWLSSVSILGLRYLNLSYNLLTGFEEHPDVLPWMFLGTLDLRSNKLQGPLPFPQVFIFTYLVSDNQLTGTIPLSICSLKVLHALDLSNNNFSDKLPQCLGNFSSHLSALKLQGNKFHGSIPRYFMKGSNLRMIDLSHNLLNGRMPRTLANCAKLQFINLGSNQINDSFPSWLGTLPNLKVLILRRNKFHGVIKVPETDAGFPELRIIDLSHNKFTGKLPSQYFRDWKAMKVVNASQLTYMQDGLVPSSYPIYTSYGSFDYSLTLSNKGIDMEYGKLSNLVTGILFSNNKFEGEIPTLIGSLRGLRSLNLSNNYLQGGIPSSLANLTVLESLDLSNNNLSGEITQNLAELTSLEYFNVSNNHLTGRIPQGKQFNTFENSSFDGNSGLCGKPLSRKCEIQEALQKGDQGSSSPFVFGWKVVVIGYVSGLIIGMVIGHMFATIKHEWFAKTFGWQLKRNAKRKTK